MSKKKSPSLRCYTKKTERSVNYVVEGEQLDQFVRERILQGGPTECQSTEEQKHINKLPKQGHWTKSVKKTKLDRAQRKTPRSGALSGLQTVVEKSNIRIQKSKSRQQKYPLGFPSGSLNALPMTSGDSLAAREE